MAKIPKFNSLNIIFEKGMIEQNHRSYIGYSSLGQECMRKTWYSFRWVKTSHIDRRVQRIFDRGHAEESIILQELADKGVKSYGYQCEVIDKTGHIKGHIDAALLNVPTAEKTEHLFEAKTMKASKFKEYLVKGLKKFNPAYWQQIHSYMGHLNITRCLYVVTNKDNEERDYKRIEFDKDQFEEGEKRGFFILTSENPPDRLPNSSSTFFECKWCEYKGICHLNVKVEKNCRTCKYWDIENDGKFKCSFWDMNLFESDQKDMSVCSGIDYELSDSYV